MARPIAMELYMIFRKNEIVDLLNLLLVVIEYPQHDIRVVVPDIFRSIRFQCFADVAIPGEQPGEHLRAIRDVVFGIHEFLDRRAIGETRPIWTGEG